MNESSGRWTKRIAGFLPRWRAGPDIVGHVDGLRDGAVYGWAWDKSQPQQRALVDVFVNDVFVGQRPADIPRPDLVAHGIGDGRHGFELTLPSATRDGNDRLGAYVISTERVELPSNDKPGAHTPISGPDHYLRETFSTLLATACRDVDDRPLHSVIDMQADKSLFHRLFASSPIAAPPPILGKPLCAYLDHNRFKWDIANEFDASTSRADYAAFSKHYIEAYGRARRPMRIPLSAQDIAFLNEGPTHENPLAASMAQRLFGGSDLSRQACADATFEAIYRWAAYDSAALLVADCLVPEPHAKLLASCEDERAAFPLSTFMKQFIAGNPFLRSLGEGDEDDRMLVYLSVLLFSMTAPHYLLFVPSRWLKTFTTPGARTVAPFDATLARISRDIEFDLRCWRMWIAGLGFDCDSKRFRYVTHKGDRLHAAALPLSDAEPVDVQIVGPFSRQLGIADSCRALAAALERLDYSLRLCDFTLDFPNHSRSCDRFALTSPGRAKINILHLNLEEMPSAVAYLPDIWTGSVIVGFPYLELQTLQPAQMLGSTLVDEFWSASDFTTRALSAFKPTYTIGTACRRLRRSGRDAARSVAYENIASRDDFVFLTACDALSGAYRKNPLGVIRAFLTAFPHDDAVKLVVKAHSIDRVGSTMEEAIWRRVRNVAAECDRIVLVDRVLDDEEQMALIEGADCLVSLHRAEGFGYHMLEAMMLETPVIATGYSGNMDFCSDLTAFLVPFELAPISPGQYPRAGCEQTWAEPDFAGSVDAMRTVFRDEAERRRKATAARELAERRYSEEALARRLDERLAPLLHGGI